MLLNQIVRPNRCYVVNHINSSELLWGAWHRRMEFSQRYDSPSLRAVAIFGTGHRFKEKNSLFYLPALLSYQRLTSSTTGTMSLLLNGGLNPPLPPPKGNQIKCSGSGRKSKANFLSDSITHVVFINSFKSPAAASFLALNLCCQKSPEQRFASFHRYHLERGEFCTFTLSKARLSPVLGCSSSKP